MHVFLSELVLRLTFLLQLCVAMVASEKAISEFDVVGQIVVCRTQSNVCKCIALRSCFKLKDDNSLRVSAQINPSTPVLSMLVSEPCDMGG